jgi:hypothetical protein
MTGGSLGGRRWEPQERAIQHIVSVALAAMMASLSGWINFKVRVVVLISHVPFNLVLLISILSNHLIGFQSCIQILN